MTPSQTKLYKRAMNKLSASDMTPRGLYAWLMEKEPDADREDAKEAIRRLADEGFVDEKRYYRSLLLEGEKKLWGKRKLAEELKKRRFNEKYLDLPETEKTDYASRALELAEKLCPGGPGDDREKKSLYGRLVARGHSSSDAADAVRELSKRRTEQ